MRLLLVLSALAACALYAQEPTVLATGLQGPQRLLLTSRGFLVSETNLAPNSGRISYLNRAGTRRSLFEALPSGTDVVGAGSGPTALAMTNPRTLYFAIGGGDSERRNAQGIPGPNPEGISSPILSSVIEAVFNNDVDSLAGTFTLSSADQRTLADGWPVELSDGLGGTATLNLLVDLPDSVREGTGFRFSNPWSLAVSNDGKSLWLADASMNTVSRVEIPSGRQRRAFLFPAQRNPTPVGPPMVDAVPTSVRVYGDELLVSVLTGFPFVGGQSQVYVVQPNQRTANQFIGDLSSAVDVAWRERPGQRTQFFVIEFSTNQLATPPGPGRLIRYDSADPTIVSGNLQAPTSLAIDEAAGRLYVLELTGRLLSFPL
jgi:hypothetical protein